MQTMSALGSCPPLCRATRPRAGEDAWRRVRGCSRPQRAASAALALARTRLETKVEHAPPPGVAAPAPTLPAPHPRPQRCTVGTAPGGQRRTHGTAPLARGGPLQGGRQVAPGGAFHVAAAAAAALAATLPAGAAAAAGLEPAALQPLFQLAADLDPGTAKLLTAVLGPLLSGLNLLFIVRIVMSWYPQLPVTKLPYSIAFAPTEPLLGPTRRLIPPIGGVDVAPVIWVAVFSFLNEVLLGQQGLLVLLSEQRP